MGFLDTATFEANYYDIKVKNAIQAPDAGDVLAQCVQTLDPLFCDNVTRVGATVTRIDGILQEQAEAVAAAYRPWFELAPPARRDEWVRINGRRDPDAGS